VNNPSSRNVFITGGSGFMGRRLTQELVSRGHTVRALVRPGSEKKLAAGATPVIGDALDKASYAGAVAPADTFVHLVGVSHPIPSKAEQFRQIDAQSAMIAIAAAAEAKVSHFVYVSVAQPAPVIQAYIAVRAECEQTATRQRAERDCAASVVRAGPGAALAAAAGADVLDPGANPKHAGIGPAIGLADHRRNDRGAGRGGGGTGDWLSRAGRAGNSQGEAVESIVKAPRGKRSTPELTRLAAGWPL
jgi:nucleoside-diphosphate-sugar epimerase